MNNHNNWTKDIRFSEKVKRRKELNIPGLSSSFSLVEFIPKDASENLWTAYFTLSEKIFREFNQRGRLPNREAVKRLLSTPNPLYTVKRWMVLDEAESATASASISYDTELSPDYESSSHICQIQIAVDPAYRRKKIATYLLKHMIRDSKRYGKRYRQSRCGQSHWIRILQISSRRIDP